MVDSEKPIHCLEAPIMPSILSKTRYLVIVPVIGLTFAACAFFVVGGVGLVALIVREILNALAGAAHQATGEGVPFVVQTVEYVHQFLIGTVFFITAAGLYQLFIHDVSFPGWLKIESAEELETGLIGVTVAVLAVNFMGFVFTRDPADVLDYGAGIALPIAALALFVGLRTWAAHFSKSRARMEEQPDDIATGDAG
jgi:uncharacterized membrane protein YqhA